MSHLSCGCKNKRSSYSVAVMVISNAIASASFPNSAQLYESGNLGKIPILPTTFFHLHFMDRPCCQPCWKLQNLLSCSNNGCTLFTLFTHSIHSRPAHPLLPHQNTIQIKWKEWKWKERYILCASKYKKKEGMFQTGTWQTCYKILMGNLPGHSILVPEFPPTTISTSAPHPPTLV